MPSNILPDLTGPSADLDILVRSSKIITPVLALCHSLGRSRHKVSFKLFLGAFLARPRASTVRALSGENRDMIVVYDPPFEGRRRVH